MVSDCLTFESKTILKHGFYEPCDVKIGKQGLEIKYLKNGEIESVCSDDIKSASWCQVAKKYGIKLISSNYQLHMIMPFEQNDLEIMRECLLKNMDVTLKIIEPNLSGKNQGDLQLESSSLRFNVDNQMAFEIPLRDVCRVSSAKNEVGIEFTQNNEAPVSLVEMRLHIPNDSVPRLVSHLSVSTDTDNNLSKAIFELPDVSSLTPRGRYTVSILPTYLNLHGKTFDFKIPLKSIIRIFCMKHNDSKSHIVVLEIDPPIRQGQTRYSFSVLQFVENINDFATIPTEYENINCSTEYHFIFCDILSKLTHKSVNKDDVFQSSGLSTHIVCAYKASNGLLYPLDRGLIFVHKPTIFIRYIEIGSVDFARGSLSARTFDMILDMKDGQTFVFTNISRENFSSINDFLSSKNLHIRKNTVSNVEVYDSTLNPNSVDIKYPIMDESDNDEDYNPAKEESSSSDDPGHDIPTSEDEL